MEGTLTIRRGNVVLDIPAEQKEYYMNLGYDVLGADGNVVEATVPTDLHTLQRLYKDHVQQIEEQEALIEELKKELDEKLAEIKSLTSKAKSKVPVFEEAIADEAEPAPKKRARRTKN